MQKLVRARIRDREVTVSASYAEAKGLEVLDEPVRRDDGRLRAETRAGGRRVKPRKSVAKKAAEKKQAAEGDPAPDKKAPSALEGDKS